MVLIPSATTHSDIVMRAKELGIEVKTVCGKISHARYIYRSLARLLTSKLALFRWNYCSLDDP